MTTQDPINLFSRLLLRQKFAILAALAALLVGIAFYSFVDNQRSKIEVTKREQQGLIPARELLALVQSLPKHRGSSTGLLNGNNDMAAEESRSKVSSDEHIAAFDSLSKSINDPALLKVWGDIKQDWPKIAQKVADRSVTAPENFQAHTKLIANVLNVLDLVVALEFQVK